MFSLKNKIIIVTGACGLLGREHVECIAKNKGIPIILDLNLSSINKLVKKIKKKYNVNSKGYVLDITNENDVSNNCEEIIKQFGKIDGLINNAANNPKIEMSNKLNFSRLENFNLKIWNDDINVSLTGSFLCLKYYGFQISQNKHGGSIINVSSDLGLIAPDQNLYKIDNLKDDEQPVKPISYSVTKTGLIGLTRYISTYWSNKKVRCNAICPGGVENGQSDNFIDKIIKKIPLGRMAKKNDYHGLIVFLLSDSSSYINGAVIPADGGRSSW